MKTNNNHIAKANGNLFSAGVNVVIPSSTWVGLGLGLGLPIIIGILCYFGAKYAFNKLP